MKTKEDALMFALDKIAESVPGNKECKALYYLYQARDQPVSFEDHESPEQQILRYVQKAIDVLEAKQSQSFERKRT